MKKKCSSPSASIGEFEREHTSAIPVQNSTRRQTRHWLPSRGERPRAAEVEDATTRVGTSCSGSNATD